ncbi:efflux pump antibiotic resistance protein [Rutstroemia sp. NJR-2017a WRK4]|nr:efflux pump antibiotic resistance protein [Rutstroemia sp. NJR-2017a WRK4]
MSQASDHAPGSSTEKAELRLETVTELGGIPEVPSRYLHGWRLGVVITSLALGMFVVALDTTIIGIVIPGFISDFSNVPIGAVVLIVASIVLDLKNANSYNAALPLKEKMKYVAGTGTVVFMGATTCLPLALQWGGQTLPWHSSKIIGLLVSFGTLTIAFGIIQWKRGDHAIIPLRVIYSSKNGFHGYLSIILHCGCDNSGFSARPSGIKFIALIVPQTICLLLVGALATKWGYYAPYIIAGSIICTIGYSLLTTTGLGTSTVNWAASQVIIGIRFGGMLQLPYTALHAVGLAIGQVLLVTNLQNDIPRLVPTTSPEAVIQAGASDLYLPTAETIHGIAISAVRSVLILALVASALCIPFSVWIENLNVHVVAKQRKEQAS